EIVLELTEIVENDVLFGARRDHPLTAAELRQRLLRLMEFLLVSTRLLAEEVVGASRPMHREVPLEIDGGQRGEQLCGKLRILRAIRDANQRRLANRFDCENTSRRENGCREPCVGVPRFLSHPRWEERFDTNGFDNALEHLATAHQLDFDVQ